MTTKEFKQFQRVVENDKRFQIKGHFMLYPQSLKFLNKPSDYTVEQADKGRDIYLSAAYYSSNQATRLDGEYFVVPKTSFCGKSRIHYKHIKTMRIYKYKY